MRVVVTGADGQLGREIVKKLLLSHQVFPLTRQELDITNEKAVEKTIAQIKPEMIVHAAAYTAVDQCELEKKVAFETNAIAPYYLAREAKKIAAKMIYISSDYVFDGKKASPYHEEDQPNPLSTYGATKWLGERFVCLALPESYIVRTSWLYGHEGKNFVKTMLKYAYKHEKVRVVADQVGSPTYTKDLAEIVSQLFGKKYGIYHSCNSSYCSWYEFAREIYAAAGCDPTLVKGVTTKEYNSATIRPNYSVMACNKLRDEGVSLPRTWLEALYDFMKEELA